MNDHNGGMSPKDKQYLDLALEGKSDEFKVKVYEIVRLFRLDASDPAFLMLISTGRLEVLLNEFPGEFEAVFRRELNALKQQFKVMQDWLTQEKLDLKGYMEGMEATGDRFVGALSEQTAELKEFASGQREQLRADVKYVVSLANKEQAEIDTQLDKKIKAATQDYLDKFSDEAPRVVKAIGKQFKPKHMKELVVVVVLAMMLVLALGVGVGWTLHQQAMGELDPAGKRQLSLKQWESLQWAVSADGQLAKNILDWNGSTVSECQNGQGPSGEKLNMVTSDDQRPIKFGNCNLWVVPPDKREFGPRPNQ